MAMLGRLPAPPSPFAGVQTAHPSTLLNGVPDNSAVVRRMRQQADQHYGVSGPLGDYPAELPHRVLQTQGGAGQVGGRGPLATPVIEAPRPETAEDLLRQIRDLLQRMPQSLSLEWRTKFIMPPRESISFIAPGGPVNVGAGLAVAVVTQTVQPRFSGFLTHVSVAVNPPGAAANITWQIRVNGAIHTEFSNRIFDGNNLGTPFPFNFELTQSRTVQLVAINGGGAILSCSGILLGWTEFLSTYKPYGSSPTTGIA